MMDRLTVQGGKPLYGTVKVSGSKNATLPLMAAALLAPGTTVINDAPDLQDIRTMGMVLRVLGAEAKLDSGVMTVDTTNANGWEAPYELVRKMRASFYVLGPLIARHGRAKISLPGGCALGPRPVDLHIKALTKLGCRFDLDSGYVLAEADKLIGARINFDISSVGATGNTIMAATAAQGETVIENAACEPEIVDLADMLNAMGAKIVGAGTPKITIEGPTPLHPVNWKVIPDRIEVGTLLIAGAAAGGNITLEGARSDHLSIILTKLIESGAQIDLQGGNIKLSVSDRLRSSDITTAIYPGFPTDLQAPWTALMALAEGTSMITETIYPERFNHVPELIRLGGEMKMKLNSVQVSGVQSLKGATVMCSDIRAGAGLVVGALAAKGTTDILRVYHLDRGYEKIEDKVRALGGTIERMRD